MNWLKGGPFLELSFLLPFESDRQIFMNNILIKLKSFTPKVEIAITENEFLEACPNPSVIKAKYYLSLPFTFIFN